MEEANDCTINDAASGDYVKSLEVRIEQQENEITGMKTLLDEMQKRVKELEVAVLQSVAKKASAQNNISSSRTPASHPKLRSTQSASKTKASQAKTEPRESLGKKSLSSEHASRGGKNVKSKGKKQSGTNKQVSYDEEEGSVRMHLRGRPVVLYKPTDFEPFDISAPSEKPENQLELEWVYGYRGRDCRSNLYFLSNGEFVYFVAAVVVLFDRQTVKQRHYRGHTDDIKCMAIHPSKTKIASGQVAGVEMDGKPRYPQIHIWDVKSLETLHILQSFERSVAAVAFSVLNEGSLLCAIDESNDHVLSVWNWQKEKKIAETKSSKDPVLGCEFNPKLDRSIVTYGKSHINFWTLDGGQLAKKQGLFEKHDKPKYILCVGFTSEGEAISGDTNGNIIFWSKETTKKITRIIENAHDGPLFSIFGGKDVYLTGGRDEKIKKWDANFESPEETQVLDAAIKVQLQSITALGAASTYQIPNDSGAIRIVSCSDDGLLLVGTRSNRILCGTFDGQFETLVYGHMDELWGLAVHPTDTHFLTGGYDKQLVLWDASSHSPIWSQVFEDSIQSASFHPVHDNVIAVGMTTGRWVAVDTTNQDVIASFTDGPEKHDVIKFSPDGSSLAVGSHDNNIYIYKVSEDGRSYTKAGHLSGHSSYITHFDWSKEGRYIQSNSGDYELLYWDAHSCKQVTSTPSLRDIEWDTQTCTLGFTVLGIWPEGADGTDINTVSRSSDKRLAASGDDFGKVHLFPYPCAQPRSQGLDYRGHSSHVTSVRFLNNNEKLLSTGGQDCSILQWAVV